MKSSEDQEVLLTTREACEILNCHPNTLRKWDKRGTITAMRFGKRGDRRYQKTDILSLLNKTSTISTSRFSRIKKFLKENADEIQKSATLEHKLHLGKENYRSEYINKYQDYHIKIVIRLANYLDKPIDEGTEMFHILAEHLAKQSVKDELTIEEAVDGIIFLKQAIWKKLHSENLLKSMTTESFYEFSYITGTYVDVVASKIAFTYHNHYNLQIERELAERKKLEQQKDEFIGIASHELKTPVTSVKAYTQVLQSRFAKAGDEKSATMLMKMDTQLDKLSVLIGDLLDVTKIEAGNLKLHEEWFDFNEVVGEIIEQTQLITEKHTIVKKLAQSKTIYGDRDRIGQVLINLISNAIKYSPRSDKIIVTTKATKNTVIACVQDFGIGIPKDKQEKVFERFYRAEDKSIETYPGMGLGLYISSEIIKRQGGKIWVESEQGKGSIFCFSLPIKEK
ncbi:MAG: helix-turn-helix domain-containing protein [Candidatus Levybacteria bacterium]|nr:helix-turn-helix domain-containing protein [Candidatus Levybacteria bacterium]